LDVGGGGTTRPFTVKSGAKSMKAWPSAGMNASTYTIEAMRSQTRSAIPVMTIPP